MHNAPAVTYPVGRSLFQVLLITVLALVTLLLALRWCQEPGALNWRQGLLALTGLLAFWVAGLGWWRSPVGRLRWDGQGWYWSETATSAETGGVLSVHLDVQWLLLLCLRSPTGALLWLWPERRTLPARWQDLRRAVFAPQARQGQDEVQLAAKQVGPGL